MSNGLSVRDDRSLALSSLPILGCAPLTDIITLDLPEAVVVIHVMPTELRIGGSRPCKPTSHTLGAGIDGRAGSMDGSLVLTMCNTFIMSVNVSVRLDENLAARLRLRSRAAGESLSDRLRRYAEEGARRDENPMLTFRDGPTGRRAGLIGGPDVWEVAMWIDDLGYSPDAAAELAADEIVARSQIDAVLAYRATYPDEIQARIDLHRSTTAAAEAR